MTDFQVGDIVQTKPARITEIRSEAWVVVGYDDGSSAMHHVDTLTRIERPRRKLRVGSVWECAGTSHYRYVHVGNDVFGRWLSREFVGRDQTSIDSDPDLWREVPVEELEREAT